MRRRHFIGLLGGSLALPLASMAANQQLARIGVLWHAGGEDEEREYFEVLIKAFAGLGYVEGKTAIFLHKYPAEQLERFDVLAKELVDNKPDVIIAVNIRGAAALKRHTQSIPIVFVLAADAVGDHLVQSLAHPGGNLTGLSLMLNDVSGKRVALLKEAMPELQRVAFIIDPKDPNSFRLDGGREAAKTMNLSVAEFPVAGPSEIETAFATAASGGFQGALVGGSMFFNERKRVGNAALANKIAVATAIAEMVPYGLLISYGPEFPEFFKRSAQLAVRILKGERPADLPVEQPTRFKQVINLRVAKQLGLSIPDSILVGSDETIE